MAHPNTTQNSVVEYPTIQPHETVTFGETLPTRNFPEGNTPANTITSPPCEARDAVLAKVRKTG